jgi:hypothetical protein
LEKGTLVLEKGILVFGKGILVSTKGQLVFRKGTLVLPLLRIPFLSETAYSEKTPKHQTIIMP